MRTIAVAVALLVEGFAAPADAQFTLESTVLDWTPRRQRIQGAIDYLYLGGHLKTGQLRSVQNRPVEKAA